MTERKDDDRARIGALCCLTPRLVDRIDKLMAEASKRSTRQVVAST